MTFILQNSKIIRVYNQIRHNTILKSDHKHNLLIKYLYYLPSVYRNRGCSFPIKTKKAGISHPAFHIQIIISFILPGIKNKLSLRQRNKDFLS